MLKSKQYLIIICFLFSGSLGLIYEVLWQRKLAVIFGTTLPALTAVLAAFMGGLALGSFIFGRLADRAENPLKIYGFLEIGVGIYCLCLPFLFDQATLLHHLVFQRFGPSFSVNALRFFLALILLVIPCSFMGGTLPVLSRVLIRSQSELGQKIGILYFINTIGAVSGTLWTGFWAIRVLGSHTTNTLAAIINISIGLLFVGISVFNQSPLSEITTKKLPERRLHWLLFVYFILGLSSMGAEVAWTRALNLVIGSTVYAFTIMLASFLLGIAIGSLALSFRIDKLSSPLQILGFLVTGTGIAIALSVAVISRLPIVLLFLYPKFHNSFAIWQFCLFLLGSVVIFPATFCMGAAFPCIGKVYINELRSVGENIGSLYLFNTLGGIVGSIVAGFLLIPLIGSRLTLCTLAVVYFAIGIFLLWRSESTQQSKTQIIALTVICTLLLTIIPDWNIALLDSGVYVYAPLLTEGFEQNRKILFMKEGLHSFVTVSEKNGVRSMRINGKTDGSDAGDLGTQVLLAQLPLLHAPNAQRALIIGLGTGVTAGSALTHKISQLDCVEIDKSVVVASHLFDHVSGNPLSSPRCHIIEADARTVLATTKIPYDVIISEPSNPWITGVSNLFTEEHFAACKNALVPTGIMCQWIHSYYMEPATFTLLCRTFSAVFPYCTLWKASKGDYLILGSFSPLKLDEKVLQNEFLQPDIKQDLERINIDSQRDFRQNFLLDSIEFQKMVTETGTRINTDNQPFVEFEAPMSIYHNTVESNYQLISKYLH